MMLSGLIDCWASSHDGSGEKLDIVEHCVYILHFFKVSKKISADEIL